MKVPKTKGWKDVKGQGAGKPHKNTRHRPFWRVAGRSIQQVCFLVFFGVFWMFFWCFFLFFLATCCAQLPPKRIFSMVCWGLGGV